MDNTSKSKLPRGRKPQWILNLGGSFAGMAKSAANLMMDEFQVTSAQIAAQAAINTMLVNQAKPMLTLQSMKIERSGNVNWAVTGDHHCGPKALLVDGKIPVKYTVSVTCAPHLDSRGFLFDQASVDLWMQRISQEVTTLSCEALVISVAERMLKKLAKDVPHCQVTELVMSLSPAPGLATVTARFGG